MTTGAPGVLAIVSMVNSIRRICRRSNHPIWIRRMLFTRWLTSLILLIGCSEMGSQLLETFSSSSFRLKNLRVEGHYSRGSLLFPLVSVFEETNFIICESNEFLRIEVMILSFQVTQMPL
jgi:hypothetical protein